MSDLMSSAFANFLDHRRATSSHRPPCGAPPPLPYPPLKLPVRLLHDSPPPAKRMRSSTSCTSTLTLPSVESPLASSLVSPVSVLTPAPCYAQPPPQKVHPPVPPQLQPPPPPPLPQQRQQPLQQAHEPPAQTHATTLPSYREPCALPTIGGVLSALSAPHSAPPPPPPPHAAAAVAAEVGEMVAARLPPPPVNCSPSGARSALMGGSAIALARTQCVTESNKRALPPLRSVSSVQASSLSSSVTNATSCHECAVCRSVFSSEAAVEQHHKRVHQRPYVCKIVGCSASFSKQNHLSRHIRIVHNKERPFACTEPGCTSRFGSKSHLGDHTRAVHMRLRNFKCNICNASWSKRFNLEKHIRIRHLGEKPFRCSLCALSFGTRSHVTRHELKVHKRASGSCGGAAPAK